MTVSWYQSLIKVLLSRFPQSCRHFQSPDLGTQYLVSLLALPLKGEGQQKYASERGQGPPGAPACLARLRSGGRLGQRDKAEVKAFKHGATARASLRITRSCALRGSQKHILARDPEGQALEPREWVGLGRFTPQQGHLGL